MYCKPWKLCSCYCVTMRHLIMIATVRVMSPADTPTADARAMTLRRPEIKGTMRHSIGTSKHVAGRRNEASLEMSENRSAANGERRAENRTERASARKRAVHHHHPASV